MSGWIGHDFADLALFASVVDQGGFTAAARKTGVPQSTISRRIAALEARIGIRLIDRTTRHMRPTEAGQRTYDHARLMLEAGYAALSSGEMLKAAPSGLLRIAAPVMLSRSIVPDAARRYMRENPLVSVSLEFTTRNLDPVEDEIDVAICVEMPARSTASIQKLFRSRLAVFVAPTYSGPLPPTPDGLQGREVFAGTRGPMQQTLSFANEGSTLAVRVDLRLRCNDIAAVIDAAAACNGFALLPDFAAPPGWQQVWADWKLPSSDILALTTRYGRRLPRVAAFLQMVSLEASEAGLR
jgi:DNA-binding transcriptional LysR family regulator